MSPDTHSPHRSYRLWIAFAVLPFLDALMGFVSFPLVWYIGDHNGRLHDPAQAARGFALLSGLLGLAVTVGAVVPAVLVLLMTRGRVTFPQVIAAGLVLGNAPFVMVVGRFVLPTILLHLAEGTMSEHLIPVSELVAGTLRVLAIGSVFGAVSAIVFWFIGLCPMDSRPIAESRT
jgi:hypothetical protein